MIGSLVRSLDIGDESYSIRTDFRDVLRVLEAFNDPDLKEQDKILICLANIYQNFDEMPPDMYQEAYEKAVWSIDGGIDRREDKPKPRTMDWEQDERLIFPAVNKIAGYETRAAEYIHWWTFLGYYMEISDGVYASVLSMRAKKANREKLDKNEQKWWNANKDICVIKKKESEEEKAIKARLNELIGG